MTAPLREWFELYRALARATLRARLTYRWNFVLSLTTQMATLTAEVLVMVFLVTLVHGIAGWNAGQILLLIGFSQAGSGLYRVFFAELHEFDRYLVQGEFDAILTRPASPLFILMTRSLDPEQGGYLLQGLAMLALGIWRSGVWKTPLLTAGATAVGLVADGTVMASLVVATATVGFWTTRIDEIQPLVLYGPEAAASYPMTTYPRAIQWLFVSVIPVALGGFIPASVMLQKHMPPEALAISLVGSGAAAVLAWRFWNAGVKRYTSTGS